MYASQHSLFARMRNISRLFCWKSTGFLPSANEVWGKVMFLHLSVRHSVHGGGSASWGSTSGMSSFWGGSASGGSGGSASRGGWADPPRYYGIQSMRRRYVSYWDAFLFQLAFMSTPVLQHCNFLHCHKNIYS